MSKTIEPIETRSAFATTVRTIRGQMEHLDKLEGAAQEHLASVMLANADRVILTLADAPTVPGVDDTGAHRGEPDPRRIELGA